MNGQDLFTLVRNLFPLNRSLSGEGNRQTLIHLQNIFPLLKILEVESGTAVFDWTVPDEWNAREAYIECPDGRRLAKYTDNNLHLVGYSEAIDKKVSRSELLEHLHYIPSLPQAIPYVTSYYERNWGFCLSQEQVNVLGEGPFRVVIDSHFKSAADGGSITYGEIFLKGASEQEVIFSTYICHPSMASNELSGPAVAIALAQYLSTIKNHFSYRILFLPETIGSLIFISKNLIHLKEKCIAGWVLTCLGDSGDFSYIPSRNGDNLADRLSKTTLEQQLESFRVYSWLDRGSDERQYCAPGVDLPFCSITRTKYGEYPEYHTSLDNLNFISEESLAQSANLFKKLIDNLEQTRVPKVRTIGEPQLGKRGLYPNLNKYDTFTDDFKDFWNVISYCDGNHTINEIAVKCKISRAKTGSIVEVLHKEKLIYF